MGEFEGVFESTKKDGSYFYDKKHIKVIKDQNGLPVYYMSIPRDISKQKKEEEILKRELYIDSLTQIYNRRKYDEIIDEKIEQSRISEINFCLVLIDIDHFKSINDNYGHEMGDFVLKEFAQLIKKSIRSKDKLFRWGGEEFALLIDTGINESFSLCEKLKRKIASYSFQSLNLTASFGISSIDKAQNSKELFANSDKALYEAKATGRDKVVIYNS